MVERKSAIEPLVRPLPGLVGMLRHAFGHNLVNGFSAFLFAATGPGAMILAVGAAASVAAASGAAALGTVELEVGARVAGVAAEEVAKLEVTKLNARGSRIC